MRTDGAKKINAPDDIFFSILAFLMEKKKRPQIRTHQAYILKLKEIIIKPTPHIISLYTYNTYMYYILYATVLFLFFYAITHRKWRVHYFEYTRACECLKFNHIWVGRVHPRIWNWKFLEYKEYFCASVVYKKRERERQKIVSERRAGGRIYFCFTQLIMCAPAKPHVPTHFSAVLLMRACASVSSRVNFGRNMRFCARCCLRIWTTRIPKHTNIIINVSRRRFTLY